MRTGLKERLRDTWIHPRHLSQREIRRFIRAEGPKLRGLLLDVGCGKKPYLRFLPNIERYVGLDLASTMHGLQDVDLVGSALALPFAECVFDNLLCTEVLEHTSDPGRALQEMARVAKKGARLLLTVPFSEQLHEEPHDYSRLTRHWLAYLMESSGWAIERMEERGGAWSEIGYRLSNFLYSSAGATASPDGSLHIRPLAGPPVVLLCTAIQLTASGLNWLWPSRLGTMGYGVVAIRK